MKSLKAISTLILIAVGLSFAPSFATQPTEPITRLAVTIMLTPINSDDPGYYVQITDGQRIALKIEPDLDIRAPKSKES